MLAPRLHRLSSHFKRNFIFFPKTKVVLTSTNSVILNQAFLCSVNETQKKTVTIINERESIAENYYRNYLLNSSKYTDLVLVEGIKTNSKIAATLNQLQQEGEDNSNLKDQLSNHLDRELNQLSFIELNEVIFLVIKFLTKYEDDPFWDKILEIISKECLTRMPIWSVDELIKMTFTLMTLKKSPKLRNRLMFKLMKKSSSSQQVVFLFYFLLRRKTFIPKTYLFNLQKKTIKILPETNFIETGIIAEGFNKSFKKLQHKDLFHSILTKAIEMKAVEQIPFHSFCRFAQVMSNFYCKQGIIEFQKNSIETALKLDVRAIIRLALSGEKAGYLDSDLRTVLMKEVKDHINELSALYIERVTYLTTLFNIEDKEFLNLALDVFETKVLQQSKLLILFIHHLIHHNIYPKNLINLVLQQELVEKVIDFKTQCKLEWWYIYCSLVIERPEYLTFDLAPNIRKKLHQLSKSKLSRFSKKQDSYLWQVESTLTKLFGEGTVKYMSPLPHYPFGLLMRFDKNLKPQKLPDELEANKKTFIIKPLKDDHIWMLFVCANYSLFLDVSNATPNLVFQTQLRQLNAVGYTTFLVNNLCHKGWITGGPRELDYLKNIINAKLEECCKDQKGAVAN